MSKIKAIVKKINQEPEIIEMDNTLESFQNLVGGYIEMITFPNVKNATIILNEEGKLDELSPTLLMPEYQDVIVGNFAIVGDDGSENISLSEEQIIKCNEYLQKFQVNNIDTLTAYNKLQTIKFNNRKKEMEAE